MVLTWAPHPGWDCASPSYQGLSLRRMQGIPAVSFCRSLSLAGRLSILVKSKAFSIATLNLLNYPSVRNRLGRYPGRFAIGYLFHQGVQADSPAYAPFLANLVPTQL